MLYNLILKITNAYNTTPQNSTLNRHGDQAYMEKAIRDAGGCTNTIAEITYPNNETQIPSHYKYTYTLQGNEIVDEFDNVDSDVMASIKEAKAAGYKMPITKEHWLYKYMRDHDGDGMVGE